MVDLLPSLSVPQIIHIICLLRNVSWTRIRVGSEWSRIVTNYG